MSVQLDQIGEQDVMAGHRSVILLNPLRDTLAHYELELIDTLQRSGHKVRSVDSVKGDGIGGMLHRFTIALQGLHQRCTLGGVIRGELVLIVWPLYGYFEPLTIIRLARCNRVHIIVHDPSPLRRMYGSSRFARRVFEKAIRRWNIGIIYHTVHAQRVGLRENGVRGLVLPHPTKAQGFAAVTASAARDGRPVVRVLGQYKSSRSVDSLAEIAGRAHGSLNLQIFGRGWPEVPGWELHDRFVPEAEFEHLITSSDCVVIPYRSFFQSGVAVRCLESTVPIAGPDHEHIAQLYGDSWAGTVTSARGWYMAVVEALRTDRAALRARHNRVANAIFESWRALE